MVLRHLPYQIARCSFKNCGRPATVADTAQSSAGPLRLCTFHANLLAQGARRAQAFRDKEKKFDLGAINDDPDASNER